MTTPKHQIKVIMDHRGTVEILHLTHGIDEARHIALDLGIEEFYAMDPLHTAVRADNVPEAVRSVLPEKVREAGYNFAELPELSAFTGTKRMHSTDDKEDSGASTVQVLHQHTLGPSAKEKAILPVAILLLGIILVSTALIVRDHFTNSYRMVANFGEASALVAQTADEKSFVGNLVNPDDSRFVALEVRSWDYWSGKAALAQNHFIRIPDLGLPSIQNLVKRDRGPATVTFKIDLGRSEPGRLHVDQVLRGGFDTGQVDLTLEIQPVRSAEIPAIVQRGETADGYLDASGIHHDQLDTFRGASRLAVFGYIEKKPDGFRLIGRDFRMMLDESLSPVLVHFLEELALDENQLEALGTPRSRGNFPEKRVTAFVQLREVYPWSEKGSPGRRQVTGEIGLAMVDGIRVGSFYLPNEAGSGDAGTRGAD